MSGLSSHAMVDRLRPELDQLVQAIESAETDGYVQGFATAVRDLANEFADLLDEHDLHWPVDPALAALEQAIITAEEENGISHWSAIRTVREHMVWARGQQAAMN